MLRRSICLLAGIVVLFVGSSSLLAQVANNPSRVAGAGNAKPVTPPSTAVQAQKPRLLPHAFWDRQNILLFSGIAVFRGMDYVSTRNFQARGREEILLPDDVVDNSAGFAALEAAGTLTSVGISYIFHRTGHHKLERWVSYGHIGVTAFGVGRNYALKSKHPD